MGNFNGHYEGTMGRKGCSRRVGTRLGSDGGSDGAFVGMLVLVVVVMDVCLLLLMFVYGRYPYVDNSGSDVRMVASSACNDDSRFIYLFI